ncbi:ABC transporter permease [Brevibacillus invocatus]|uniref:ABC transporter permease n=1 Tax=Brevibacillus invocatus TaxID=173959 RepID=UPI00203DED95|nr:ABC transporter permease [Brevibacillus invocatus]MCM3078313.1 ABC transporter permease [Brevibacillus invocatus]MCM3428532.1 ABC transporter permease [Brevibacillus invocatus]
MHRYLFRRLLSLLGTLLGVTILIFLLVNLIPGDPVQYLLGEFPTEEAVAAMNAQLGLDKPWYARYFSFVAKLLQGDLGTSYITGYTVWQEIEDRFPITMQLALYSIILATVIGVVVGMVAAVKQNTWVDRLVVFFSLLGISAPGFWIALFLIWIFAYQLSIFPISGYDGFFSLILPSITLALGGAGMIARMTRSSMLDVIKQEYMRTAQAKGAPRTSVIIMHGLQNAIIPVITLIGIEFGSLLAGAIVTETVFSLQGLGSLAIEAIGKRDLPTIQGIVFFSAVLFALTNLLVDLLYTLFDPRIKYE